MGRKNQIEGQLNFLEMFTSEGEIAPENRRESGLVQEVSKGVMTAGTFTECNTCWCATCEHSTVGGSAPRPFGEVMRACPSCELCVSEGKADVCVIGSADEGCRYRAEKEGN